MGGNLSLDFADTVDDRGSVQPAELLNNYSDLLRWGAEAGVLSKREADSLGRLAANAPGHAQSALVRAQHLREAVYSIFSAVAQRRAVPGNALTLLNLAVQEAAAHARLAHGQRRFSWEWVTPEEHLDSVLWPVARSAADLLISPELSLVRLCASPTCGWLFLDQTKNHRRRWCEMRTCGNRDKARRYYERKRA